jgi:hypothetical protein
MLDKKPGLRPDVPCFLDPPTWAAYFELREDSTVKDESHEETQQPLRYAEQLEALHIAHIALYDWENLWNRQGKGALKECLTNAMLVQFLCFPMNRTTIVHHDMYVVTYHQEIIKKIILAFGPYNRLMRPREASRGLTWVI